MKPLSWPELRGRNYGAADRNIVAAISTRDHARESVNRVWFAAPRNWRIENDQLGVIHIRNDTQTFLLGEEGRLELHETRTMNGWMAGHASEIVHAYRNWPIEDQGTGLLPVKGPVRVEIDGRAAWEMLFDQQRNIGQVTVTFDDETGLVLAWVSPAQNLELKVEHFELDATIDPEKFRWTGEFSTRRQKESQEREEKRQKLQAMSKPLPGYWPTTVGAGIRDGDPTTGAIVLDLHLGGGAQLARWPVKTPPPDVLGYGHGFGHEHRWRGNGWNWCLRASHEFTDDELARVKASLPKDKPPARVVNSRQMPGPDPTHGEGQVRLFQGPVNVDYGQFYVLSEGELNPDMQAAFASQRNGLCGGSVDGALHLTTGLQYGQVTLTVDMAAAEPAVDDSWDEIVEVPFTVISEGGVSVVEWAGEGFPVAIPLAIGAYRVRYSAKGMDAAHQGQEIDEYLLTFWPAKPEPDAIIKQTSDQAAYWHTAFNGNR